MILQFGAGNFLRGFADLFISQMNRDPATAVGRIVVLQSTGQERAEALNRAQGSYHVAIQGFENGRVIDETQTVDAISEALHADSQWERVLEVGIDPDLTLILSNTTEAGLALDSADDSRGGVPRSFPGKLLEVLLARWEASETGPWIVPCELVESNAKRLRDLVLEQAVRWTIPEDACAWIRHECRWVNSLVDRIVPGPPQEHPLLSEDPLLLSAEPYASWTIETDDPESFPLKHPAIVVTSDITPFTLRKVRILNGAHSALVAKARGFGVETVRECLEHPEIGTWLERLLFEEVVPVLEGRTEDPAGFARTTLDRFRNPFLEHRLESISLHHAEKVAVRLRPTLEEYESRFGKSPPLLAALLDPEKDADAVPDEAGERASSHSGATRRP